MADEPAKIDIRQQIENALAILAAQAAGGDPRAAHQSLPIAIDTLRAARAAIDELDGQLELLTEPGLDVARELQRRTRELGEARRRAAALDQVVARLRAENEVEESLHEEDQRRLQELQKRVKGLDDVLMNDDAAFGRFMDKALDEQDRHGPRES